MSLMDGDQWSLTPSILPDLWLAEEKLHDVLLKIQRLSDNHAVA